MADQVYVTHCLQNDSIKNQTGFGVRAASTEDPELLKFAAEFPAYELPMDMWTNEPSPAKAPRRLALVNGPRNTLALIHSAYAGKDTMGRSGNFFTHVLFYPNTALSALDAVKSWRAPEWQTSYPQGASKVLPKLNGSPFDGRILSDEALTRFLSGKGVDNDQNLATLACPARLLNDAARCQQLLARTMEACLAGWNAGSARNRVYLVAEPGLIALMLYGAMRLLPASVPADWFFSTFENSHRTLRHFRQAFVCGTYLSDTQKGLDPDYFRTPGFGFDAIVADRASPELAGESSTVVKILVRLAAEGKWDVVSQMHACHAPSRVSTDSLSTASRLYNLFIKAKGGRLTPEELLEMRKSPEGESLIQKNAEIYWPLVLGYAQANEVVRREFADMIRKRSPELVPEAGRQLAASNANWHALWTLVKGVESSKERLGKLWISLLQHADAASPQKAYVPAQRVRLLQESQQVYATPAAAFDAVDPMLALSSEKEFEQLQKAKLPPDWLARSLELGLEASPPEPWVTGVLGAASDKLLEAFVARLMQGQSADGMLRKLQVLVPNVAAYPVFFRLLKSGLIAPPEVVCGLLDSLKDAHRTYVPIWTSDEHLELLLRSQAAFKERAEPIWFRFCRFLDKNLLFGDAGQRALYDNLTGARDKAKSGVPRVCAQLLDDWTTLLTLFANPQSVAAGADEIEAICERRKLGSSGDLLKEYFAKVFQRRPLDDARIGVFAGTFDRVLPQAEEDHQHLDRFDFWVDLVSTLPDAKKVAMQKYYLKRLPAPVCRQLLDDRRDAIAKPAYDELFREMARKKEPEPAANPAPAAKHAEEEPAGMMAWYVNLGLAFILGIALTTFFIFVGSLLGFPKLPRHDLDDQLVELKKELAGEKEKLGEVNTKFGGVNKELTRANERIGAVNEALSKANTELKGKVEALETVTKERDNQKEIAEKVASEKKNLQTEFENYKKKPKTENKPTPKPEVANATEADKKIKKLEDKVKELEGKETSWNTEREKLKKENDELKRRPVEAEKPVDLSVERLFAADAKPERFEIPGDPKGLKILRYQDGKSIIFKEGVFKEGVGDVAIYYVAAEAKDAKILKISLKGNEKNTVLTIEKEKKPKWLTVSQLDGAKTALRGNVFIFVVRGEVVEKRFRFMP